MASRDRFHTLDPIHPPRRRARQPDAAAHPMPFDDRTLFRLLADLVLVTHVGFVAFVVIGLGLIIAGGRLGWTWVRNPWFRLAHLTAIGVVMTQAWFSLICPLTTLEMNLRERAGEAPYQGSFVAHWMHRILYYEAPPWVFVVTYTIFGLLVAGTWFRVRPRSFGGEDGSDSGSVTSA